MKERPILFSGPMVRAILEGRKTMTRRVVKPAWFPVIEASYEANGYVALQCLEGDIILPYGEIGDRLWVRETWKPEAAWQGSSEGCRIKFRADNTMKQFDKILIVPEVISRWRPSIFMPRWASRIALEVVSVKVERVQDISPEDCRKEGVGHGLNDIGARYAFGSLWNEINAKRGYGWDTNPWVWRVEFKRVAT